MVAKDKNIQQLEGSHQQIEKLVSQADHSLENYPGWTIREVLAHFTGWDTAVIASLKLHAAVRASSVVAEGDHNGHNAATVSEREALSFEYVYQEWQHTHEQLKITIHDLLPKKWKHNSSSLGGRPAI